MVAVMDALNRAQIAGGGDPFVGQKLGTLLGQVSAGDLEVLTGLVEAGDVSPAVDRTFPLEDVAAAIRYLRAGQARGKVVISVSD